MRLAAGLLAPLFCWLVFFTAREFFGDTAGLIALVLVTLDPNVLAHSALVTTDIGVSLFFLASIYAFYRYVKQPSMLRLAIAGLMAGLLLATKHSGILLAPMLFLLDRVEVLVAARRHARSPRSPRLSGAVGAWPSSASWCFGLLWLPLCRAACRASLSAPSAEFVKPPSHFTLAAVMFFARLHLLPESWLIGLVDVKRMAEWYPTFVLGASCARGVVLLPCRHPGQDHARPAGAGRSCALRNRYRKAAVQRPRTGVPARPRTCSTCLPPSSRGWTSEPGTFFRWTVHICARRGRRRGARCQQPALGLAIGILVAAHVISSLAVFPNYMAYANEAWGGPRNVHNLLSDANVDWAQQLYQVRAWQDRHPGEECWFAYFAYPEIDPATYGIPCHHLPNAGTGWAGGIEDVPPVIDGTVLLSASNMVACESPDSSLNPYLAFESMKPTETIGYGLMIFKGHFDMRQAAALARTQKASETLRKRDNPIALELAQQAVALDPALLTAQSTLGDALARMGRTEEARSAWQTALDQARRLPPATQTLFVPRLEAKLKK